MVTVSPADKARNLAAKFHPQDPSEDGSLPAIENGGAFVFAYWDRDGLLRVSIDLDTVDPELVHGADQLVALQVDIQGGTVYVTDADGRETSLADRRQLSKTSDEEYRK